MELRDSRRLTGPNLLAAVPGAVLDVRLDGEPAQPLIDAWREQASRILEAVGWADAELAARAFPGGASLFLSGPIDALYAATEVNEWAFEAAVATLEGRPAPRLDQAAARLKLAIWEEANPALLDLQRAAAAHGVTVLADDELASVGLGAGSLTFPAGDIPAPEAIDWSRVHDIPVALVTGTNGKTTTVRMLAAIAEAAGQAAGYTSTDGIVVAGETVDRGDWSGPGGARRLLRDRRVELAVLECARGGMLRRGLPVPQASVAVVTNVAADHLGEWGVADLDALADAKLIVARATTQLVLNADDPLLERRGRPLGRDVVWFSSVIDESRLEGPGSDDDALWYVANGQDLAYRVGCLWHPDVLSIEAIPATLGGAAGHNVANALAAAAAAQALLLPDEAIARGLSKFRENPGRLERFDLGGVRVIVDFAHNPHGLEALLEMARSLLERPRHEPVRATGGDASGSGRLLVTLGQAGDRSDEDLRTLARAAAAGRPDRILVKELHDYLRGRDAGEIPRLLTEALREAGYAEDRIGHADSEMSSVREALRWAQPGDLLLLLTHAERSAVVSYIRRLEARGWTPGDQL